MHKQVKKARLTRLKERLQPPQQQIDKHN